jgi:hypothetical protein
MLPGWVAVPVAEAHRQCELTLIYDQRWGWRKVGSEKIWDKTEQGLWTQIGPDRSGKVFYFPLTYLPQKPQEQCPA